MIDLPALAADGDGAATAALLKGDALDRRALAAALLMRAQGRSDRASIRQQVRALQILDALADDGCEEAAVTLTLAGWFCSAEAWALAVGT